MHKRRFKKSHFKFHPSFMDFVGVILALGGLYTALLGLEKSSAEALAVAFALIFAAAAMIWANGLSMVPIQPPDDWDEPRP